MKKKLSCILIFIMTAIAVMTSYTSSFAEEQFDTVDILSNYGIVIDYETGKVLGGENIHSKLYPASTTKIWTAYLVIKNVDDLNKTLEITEPPGVEGSSMYLEKGEVFTIRELLEGLLIRSSNDVAEVLAKYVSGSVEEFSKLMNEEAKKAGALNTHFNNPHGLPDDNHYTTPYDMAMLGRKAMTNSVIREIVSTKSVVFKKNNTPTSKVHFDRYFTNTNLFLTSNDKITYKGQSIPIKYDIVDGIKTGYTDLAGRCLLSSAKKGDMRVISAVFKSYSTNVYVDSRTLLDHGLDNYHSYTVIDKDDYTKTERVLFSKEKEFIYQPKSSYKLVFKNGESKESDYSYKETLEYSLPISKGDKVGTIEIYNGSKLEKTIDLVSTTDLKSSFAFFTENKLFKFMLIPILVIAFLLCLPKKFKKIIKKVIRKIGKKKKGKVSKISKTNAKKNQKANNQKKKK